MATYDARARRRVRPLTAVLAAVTGLLLLGAAPATPLIDTEPQETSGVDPARLPAAARAALPLVSELTAQHCPELPPVWVLAQVQTESGWDETATSSDGAGGAAGLLQFDERSWTAAGGPAWLSDPPGAGEPVTSAAEHLRVAVPWLCANLRAVTRHLDRTGKPTTPLDAMLVCHIAGCARVTESALGVPAVGEAGCSLRCTQVIGRYLQTVHSHVDRFTARPPDAARPELAPPAWTGGATGCRMDDPTGDGCLTGATRHGLDSASSVFGSWSDGPVIRSAGCWDAHAWNPRSDHPRGRACDLFAAAPGSFAKKAELDAGWRVARWYQQHAAALKVRYLIWQGRYWAPDVADQDGWGRRYTGGGIYDTRNATGGHYDHIHVSFRE